MINHGDTEAMSNTLAGHHGGTLSAMPQAALLRVLLGANNGKQDIFLRASVVQDFIRHKTIKQNISI